MPSNPLDDLGQARPKKFQLSYRALPGWFVPVFATLGLTLFSIAVVSNSPDTFINATAAMHRLNNRGVVALIQQNNEPLAAGSGRIAPPGLFNSIPEPTIDWTPTSLQ